MSLALLVGFGLSLLLKWHFLYFATTFSNRREFSAIFPFLVLTVALVIAIVKSSLALSLGLVGALSIVRFRTPIKEPEELAYIFMAIAIGIGLGANQIGLTIVSTLIILTFMALVKLRQRTSPQNLFLSITNEESGADLDVKLLGDQVAASVDECELRRVDVQGAAVQVVYFVATNCHLVQGYLMSRPLCADDFVAFAAQGDHAFQAASKIDCVLPTGTDSG